MSAPAWPKPRSGSPSLRQGPTLNRALSTSLTVCGFRPQIIDEHVDYANAILHEAETSTGRRLGEQAREHMGVQYYEPFSKEWEHPIPRNQITSEHAMETVFAR